MKPLTSIIIVFALACISASALTLEKEVPESDKASQQNGVGTPDTSSGPANEQSSGSTLTLSGQAEHSITLPPIPATLQPGQTFNLSVAEQGFATNHDWRQIPPWLAGTWHTDVEYALQNSRPVGYVTRSTRTFGSLADRFGNVWQYKKVPWSETVDDGNTLDSKLVIFEKRLGHDPNSYVDKAITVDVIYDRNSGRILNTYQQEELQWTYPQPDHTLRVDESIKRYDAMGQPGPTRQGYFIRQPVGPFTMRWDLLDSFKDYLAGHGMEGAIPQAPAASAVP